MRGFMIVVVGAIGLMAVEGSARAEDTAKDFLQAYETAVEHFERGRGEDALEAALRSARTGNKYAQALAAEILVNGKGGVQRDIERGYVWLSVAARPPAKRTWQKALRQVRKGLSAERRETLDARADEYRQRFGAKAQGVRCEMRTRGQTRIARLLVCVKDGMQIPRPEEID